MSEEESASPPPTKRFKTEPSSSSGSCLVSAENKRHSFLWIVWNFKYFPVSSTQELRSAEFQTGGEENLKWHMKMICLGKALQPSLVLVTNNGSFFSAHVTLSIIGINFQKHYSRQQNFSFRSNRKTSTFENYIQISDILNDDCKNLLDDDLLLLCEFSIHPFDSVYYTPKSNIACGLVSDMKCLLEEKYFSDFLVVVKDKEFWCHKAVLACRSEFFASMLKYETKEKQENKVVLNDIDPCIFDKLLRYIYTGTINITPTHVFQLLVAADKYRLERLQILCEVKLSTFLCEENAMGIYKFAIMYNVPRVRMQAERIIQAFRKQVGGWHYYHTVPGARPPTKRKRLRELFENEVSIVDLISSSDDETSEVEIIQFPAEIEVKEVSCPAVDKNKKIKSPQDIEVNFGASCSKWSDDHIMAGLSPLCICKPTTITIPPKADVWCCTKTYHLCTMKWKIEDAEEFCGCRSLSMKSLDFFAEDKHNGITSSWQLELSLLDQRLPNLGTPIKYLSVSLRCTSWNKDPGVVDYRLFLISKHYTEYKTITGSQKFKLNVPENVVPNFVKASRVNNNYGLLHDGSIILCCVLMTRKSSLFDSIEPLVVPECDLSSCISALVPSTGFVSDVCLTVGSYTFFCHKGLLSCRSLYLKDILEKQPEKNDYNLGEDIDPILFKYVLSYIYGSLCDVDVEIAKKLLPLSNKFCLSRMKRFLENILTTSLSHENAATLLIFSEYYAASFLKSCTLEYISMNLKEVMNHPSWADIMKNENLFNQCLNASVERQAFQKFSSSEFLWVKSKHSCCDIHQINSSDS